MGAVGPPGGRGRGGGGQNLFSKNLIFKRFAAKFFSKVSSRYSEGQKGSVNLTFSAFLHRQLSALMQFPPPGL